jgi:hypothetical protein
LETFEVGESGVVYYCLLEERLELVRAVVCGQIVQIIVQSRQQLGATLTHNVASRVAVALELHLEALLLDGDLVKATRISELCRTQIQVFQLRGEVVCRYFSAKRPVNTSLELEHLHRLNGLLPVFEIRYGRVTEESEISCRLLVRVKLFGTQGLFETCRRVVPRVKLPRLSDSVFFVVFFPQILSACSIAF